MPTALIIDDDADMRRLMAEALQAGGWQVWDADSGERGLELAREHRPRIIVCDLLMPRGNGFQVCRAVRGEPPLQNTRILVTSGRAYESDRKAAFEAGADEYLVKPFDVVEFTRLLQRLAGNDSTTTPVPSSTVPTGDERADTRIRFWGVRGSIATPGPATAGYGGNTSCVEVRCGGEIIILDAGTGLRPLGRELDAEFSGRPLSLNLLLSHTHWDHIQGLPFFQPLYRPHNHIRILGYEGARSGLFQVLSSQMESPYFPVGLKELPSNVEIDELRDLEFTLGTVRVAAFFANHPGICVGYRLTTPGGSIAFFPDNEPPRPASNDPRSRTAYAAGEARKFIEFLRGVDVAILDAQYDAAEYQRHVGWGHGCVDDVVGIAIEAQVRRLFLFHHDPDHDDAKVDELLAHSRELARRAGSPLQVDAAREGLSICLPARG
ncbi:MAG: response regulator [Limisphaerales bacterium]|jgi:phosphoribosyl 1,2-cyclic phosphodiesterase/CheY-like chemotaxis protein